MVRFWSVHIRSKGQAGPKPASKSARCMVLWLKPRADAQEAGSKLPGGRRNGQLIWLQLMWLQFEVVRGSVGVVWGRFVCDIIKTLAVHLFVASRCSPVASGAFTAKAESKRPHKQQLHEMCNQGAECILSQMATEGEVLRGSTVLNHSGFQHTAQQKNLSPLLFSQSCTTQSHTFTTA